MINTPSDDIVLDLRIKTHKRNVHDLHVKLGHPYEAITRSTTKGLGIQVTGTFKLCKDCILGKAKQHAVNKWLYLAHKF